MILSFLKNKKQHFGIHLLLNPKTKLLKYKNKSSKT
jgi:hypothetical protein